MRISTKKEAISVIKSMLRRRLKAKGHDLKSISDKWLSEKAEEIYLKEPDGIKVLESK